MQLKQTLVGAIVGGVLGAVLLIASFFLFGWEHTVLAVPVAILVGLGVRAKVATRGHASYGRGALTALLALAAFMCGKFLVAEIAARQTLAATKPSAISAPPKSDEAISAEDEVTAAEAEPPVAESTEASEEPAQEITSPRLQVAEESRELPLAGPVQKRPIPGYVFSTWDFIWLVVAALIAYEFGRGSGLAAPGATAPSSDAATA